MYFMFTKHKNLLVCTDIDTRTFRVSLTILSGFKIYNRRISFISGISNNKTFVVSNQVKNY